MRTHYRGRILIQAALKIGREDTVRLKLDPDKLLTGAIVGAVNIVDCAQNSKSNWAEPGQWHWLLENPRVLAKPISFERQTGLHTHFGSTPKDARFRTSGAK